MLAETDALMRRLAKASPGLIFIRSNYIRVQYRTYLCSRFTSTPYAVDCRVQVIGKISKNSGFRAGVKLICLQIAICDRAYKEDKYSNNNSLSGQIARKSQFARQLPVISSLDRPSDRFRSVPQLV